MKKLVTSLMFAVAGFAGVANAQDGCFYLGATGSANWHNATKVSNKGTATTDLKGQEYKHKAGLGGSLAVGYILNQWRFEIEGAVRGSELKGSNGAAKTKLKDFKKARLTTYALMANAFYDIPVMDDLSIYVGAGLGFANTVAKLEAKDHKSKSTNYSDVVFAYQAMTGVAYDFNEQWTATLGYRLFATSTPKFDGAKTLHKPFSNGIEAGVRFKF